MVALARKNGDERAERLDVTETPFELISGGTIPLFDANSDHRIDRKTEVVLFNDGGFKSGPTYMSIRALADAADMVAGNRDGFMTSNEYQDLARMYTVRDGATGLTGREMSVFTEDYGVRSGDGGSVDEMQGNPYF